MALNQPVKIVEGVHSPHTFFRNVPILSDSFINIDPAIAFRESTWGIWFEGPAAQAVFSHKLFRSIWYHFFNLLTLIQKLIMYWLLLACWYVFWGPYNRGPSKRYFSTIGLTWFGLPLVFGNQVFEDVVAWWSRRKARWCPSEVGLSLDEVLGWWMLMVFFWGGTCAT